MAAEGGALTHTESSSEPAKDPLAAAAATGSSLLTFHHAFGLLEGVHANVHFLEENILLFPVGKHVAIYNTDTRQMRFILETEKVDSIIAMSVTQNKKYLALSERSGQGAEAFAQISIVNLSTLKRMRTLTSTEITSREFVDLCFSGDGKYLVAMSGPPDWALVYYDWHRSKVMHCHKMETPVERISINPWDVSHIATTGPKLLKLWRIIEGVLKGYNAMSGRRELQNYTDHAWLADDRLIVSTETGDVLLLDQGELRQTFPEVHGEGNTLTTLLTFSKGFVVAGDGGLFSVFEKDEQEKQDDGEEVEEVYRAPKTFRANEDDVFWALAISPSEESIACTLKSSQLALFSLTDSGDDKGESRFALLSSGFHIGNINGMDVATRKPLIVTCGQDFTLRIWNYLEKTCELVHKFHDEPISCAIHPDGFQVVVGFADKLRLYTILVDELRQSHEFPCKWSREVAFSHGGHMVAAIQSGKIHLFSLNTLDLIGCLQGHTGPVRSICWHEDDLGLVSAGMDGAVYSWKLEGLVREDSEDFVQKTCQHTAVVVNAKKSAIVVASSDKRLREVSGGTMNQEFATLIPISQLSLSNSNTMLYAGTVNGTIRTYQWPVARPDYYEYIAHAGAVTRLKVSFDDNFVFSVAADGTLFIFEVQHIEDGRVVQKKVFDRGIYKDVVMTTKYDRDEKLGMIEELQSRIGEIQAQTEYQLHLKEQHFQEQMKIQAESSRQAMELAEQRYMQLKREKDKQEREAIDEIQSMEAAHMRAAEELENLYERKLAMETARYELLMQEKDDLECKAEEKLLSSELAQQAELERTKQMHSDQIVGMEGKYRELLNDYNSMKAYYDENIRQKDEEHELEVMNLRNKKEKELDQERKNAISLRTDTAVVKNRYEALKQDLEEMRRALRNRDQDIRLANKNIAELEKTVSLLKKDIKEREVTIIDKEKRISDLKAKNKELEKFKFVLDYKIQELKKEIDPKDEKIESMKEQIAELDKELERDMKNRQIMEQTVSEKNMKIDGLNMEIKKLRRKIMDKERYVNSFKRDLHAIICSSDLGAWKDMIQRLHDSYVSAKDIQQTEPEEGENRMKGEFERQREYMERSMLTLKKKVQQSEEQMNVRYQGKVAENAQLIRQLNEVRRENHDLHLKVNEYKSAMQMKEHQALEKERENRAALKVAKQGSQTPGSITPGAGRGQRKASTPGRPLRQMGKSAADLNAGERSRMAEMMAQLDENNREIEMQRIEIRRLRDQVHHLLRRTPMGGDTPGIMQTPDLQGIGEGGRPQSLVPNPPPAVASGGPGSREGGRPHTSLE